MGMTQPTQSNTRIKMRISILSTFFILVFFTGGSDSKEESFLQVVPKASNAPRRYNGDSKSAVDVGFDDEEVFFVSVTSDGCKLENRENAISTGHCIPIRNFKISRRGDRYEIDFRLRTPP